MSNEESSPTSKYIYTTKTQGQPFVEPMFRLPNIEVGEYKDVKMMCKVPR